MTAIQSVGQTGSAIADEVASGLTRTPKSLSPHLFYDEVGSQLFEQITALPEYYLTRTERQILETNATAILRQAGQDLSLIELGAGTAAKTGIIIRALLRRQLRVLFYPIDVSASALEIARERLSAEFPSLRTRSVVADYTSHSWPLPAIGGRKLVLYLGSSIGNFEPDEAAAILLGLREHLAPGDCLLLGTDLVKHASLLIPAYNDARRVTERFNKNMLARINRELGGRFDLHTFRHMVRWNSAQRRIEMYLESTRTQEVAIAALGITVQFIAGERIHTENSYKYTPTGVQALIGDSGLQLERTWTDARRWFAVHLIRVV